VYSDALDLKRSLAPGSCVEQEVEATTGIEPVYAVLQTAP
jgi:hypothetical protein